jgi:cytochrome P450
VADEDHYHLIFTDPPHHTLHRQFLTPELAPISVRNLTDHMEVVVDDILDEVVERGECDFVPDVAGKLASYVTADFLGLPRPLVVELYKASDTIATAPTLQSGDGLAARTMMFTTAQEIYADRRARPRPDMLTRMAHGEVDGRAVDEAQFAIDFLLLVVAGGDTTRNVVAGGMEQLFSHPAQWASLLEDDPKVIASAVEEMLRWTTPIVHQRRLATKQTEINDQAIEKGQKVVAFFGAANRDPDVFTDPERFDIFRSPNAHVAFGFGPHFCLGSHLARLEMKAMFHGIVRRLPDLEQTGPAAWLNPNEAAVPQLIGPKTLPVRFKSSRPVRAREQI